MTFFQLISRYATARNVLERLPEIFKNKRAPALPARRDVEAEWERLNSIGADLVCAVEPAFPSLLKQLSPPPPVLSALGALDLASQRTVAIVGARQASALGRKIARDLAHDLSGRGYVIVSGLARGIDGEAHASALKNGTVAVLGGGIDHIYPPQHKDLYEAIAAQGLIISENPIGHRATARDFPRRNRIVTGLAEGVILVEAAERSGSLISARTALEQNREVFAVPGSPLDPRYAGSNRILRDGAILVRHADDVIEALSAPQFGLARAPDPHPYETEEIPFEGFPASQLRAVESVLTLSPAHIDDIAIAADLGVPRCAAILVELELAGIARTYSGGMASLSL